MAFIVLLVLLASAAFAEIEIVDGPGENSTLVCNVAIVDGPGENSTLVCNETWVAWGNNTAPYYDLLSRNITVELGTLVNATCDIYAVHVLEGSMPILPVVYFESGENGTLGRPVVCRNPPAPFSEYEGDDTPQVIVIYITSSLAIIASVYALLTYALLKSLRTLPGLVIMNLFLAFLLGEIMLQIRIGMEYNGIRPLVNYAISQGLLVARFLWMSLTGFEMCRSLYRGIRMVGSSWPYQKWVMLAIYMFIGWGITISLMIIMFVVEEKEESLRIRRLFGVVGYLTNHVPIAVTLAFNISVVVFISIVIVNASRRQRRLSQSSYRKTQNVNFVRLFLVLLTVLGLFWVLFFVLVYLPEAHTQKLGVIIVYVILTDTQPIFVCIAFICTPKIFRMWLVRLHIRKDATSSSKTSKRTDTLMSIHESTDRDLHRGRTVTLILPDRDLTNVPYTRPASSSSPLQAIAEESDQNGEVRNNVEVANGNSILRKHVTILIDQELHQETTKSSTQISEQQSTQNQTDCPAQREREETEGFVEEQLEEREAVSHGAVNKDQTISDQMEAADSVKDSNKRRSKSLNPQRDETCL